MMDEEIKKALEATKFSADEFRLKAPFAATSEYGVALKALCFFQPEAGEVFYPMPTPHDKIAERYGIELNPAPQGDLAPYPDGTKGFNTPFRNRAESRDPKNTAHFEQDAKEAADRMLEQLKQEPNQ